MFIQLIKKLFLHDHLIVELAIANFEHVIDVNNMLIEQIRDQIKFCVSNSFYWCHFSPSDQNLNLYFALNASFPCGPNDIYNKFHSNTSTRTNVT